MTDLTGLNTGPSIEFSLELTVGPRTSVGAQLIRIRATKSI
tara:strand:+ start:862 stop:984 length:123 start_codon:yes stop_codon:yes gene_type:complete